MLTRGSRWRADLFGGGAGKGRSTCGTSLDTVEAKQQQLLQQSRGRSVEVGRTDGRTAGGRTKESMLCLSCDCGFILCGLFSQKVGALRCDLCQCGVTWNFGCLCCLCDVDGGFWWSSRLDLTSRKILGQRNTPHCAVGCYFCTKHSLHPCSLSSHCSRILLHEAPPSYSYHRMTQWTSPCAPKFTDA